MRVMVIGHGRAGKDTCCEILSELTGLKNAGTTSSYLAEFVAHKLGVSPEEAYSTRHESVAMRQLWYETGNEIREKDPLVLIKMAYAVGDITGGVRDLAEILYDKEEGLSDLIIWVERASVPTDPTLKIPRSEAHVIIDNNGPIEELREKLRPLATLIITKAFFEKCKKIKVPV